MNGGTLPVGPVSATLLEVLATLGLWTGIAMLFGALLSRGTRAMYLFAGAVLLIISGTLPARQGEFGVPLLWPAMPFAGWLTLVGIIGALLSLAKWISLRETKSLRSVTIFGVIALLGFGLYQLDSENQFQLLRGKIALSPASAIGLLLAASAAVLVMVRLGRRVERFGVQLALIAGSVVFGIPFLWLLLTSFKEDRDIASAEGLVWVPRVQRTVPFRDPEEPLYTCTYKGDSVQALAVGRTSSGRELLEIQRPSSLRGISFEKPTSGVREIAKDAPVVSGKLPDGTAFTGFVARELPDGRRSVRLITPAAQKASEPEIAFAPGDLEPVRDIGLRTQNYVEALEALPPETEKGALYLRNTLLLVVLSVTGTLLSSSIVAYGFARLRFPGRDTIFKVLLATMMLPGAVTLMPQFLLFRAFGWVDTLLPLWVPSFFASAFNVFLLRQFFAGVPMELEDAGKIDGAGTLRTFWSIMLPQIRPALAVVAIWTFMGAWNDFMGPLIYIDSPEKMPLSYALQLFQGERGGEPGLMLAFATMTILPVVALFAFAQRYFIEGVTLSGLGGR